jgi:hypothetical protein
MGRKFYLVHDPKIGLQFLADTGELTDEELQEINNLCIDLGQEPIERHNPPQVPRPRRQITFE